MTEINWNKDLFPDEIKNYDLEDVRIRLQSFHGIYIEKGTLVGIAYENKSVFVNELFKIYTPVSGFIDFAKPMKSYGLFEIYAKNSILFTVKTLEEKLNSIKIEYQIHTDPYTGDKRVLWDPPFKSQFDYIDGKPCLSYLVSKDNYNPILNDSFSMLFTDGEVRTFILKNKPLKEDNKHFKVTYEITKSDLDKLINVPLVSYRFNSKSFKPYTVELKSFNSVSLGQAIYKKSAIKFEEALNEVGFKWQAIESTKEKLSSNEPCFVYLMVDAANGFHKIGISNNPEYREGTLQSEKPTIELVCAKQFPSRTIAKAIESALHKTYETKHLRGEWFQLEAKDIVDIMATLQ